MAGLLAQTVATGLAYPVMAVAGVAAVSIPVMIHLWTRRRRRPQPWAAMRFLLEVQRRHRHRLQLEQLLLLAVRCLIPLVLGLALSGPFLAGCAAGVSGWWGGSWADPGRLVCLVIDDSLSSQVQDSSGRRRFDQLRQRALGVIELLEPSDRVAVWRATEPAGAATPNTSLGLAGARDVLGSINPRYGRGDVVGTLSRVHETLSREPHPKDRVCVVLISDFARHVIDLDQPIPSPLLELGHVANLRVTQPMPEAFNEQISKLVSRQSLIFTPPGQQTPTVPVEIHLRRFVDRGSRDLTRLELSVTQSPSSEVVSQTRLDHRWSTNQNEAVVHTSVPLASLLSDALGSPDGVGKLTIRARIDHEDRSGEPDTLAADNEQWVVVDWRRHIRVGLIDRLSSGWSASSTTDQLEPGRWVSLALAPQRPMGSVSSSLGTGNAGLSVMVPETIEASRITTRVLEGVDVAIVLRPDLLDQQGWLSLRQLADRGGLVWLCAPVGEPTAVWGTAMADHLDLPWRLGLDSIKSASQTQTAGQRLVVDDPVPEPLNLLGADWAALLAPVRVRKQFDLIHQRPSLSPESVWLRTADTKPLLVSCQVGLGRVLLLATAIDPEWTNLPTKPFFVPLLHETIRAVLGSAPSQQLDRSWVSGQPAVLGHRWAGAKGLVLSSDSFDPPIRVRLHQGSIGLQTVGPLDQPGVYVSDPAGVGQVLAVNIDPRGGDTRAIDRHRLGEWLSRIGAWSWLDDRDPAVSLEVAVHRANLAWPLVWAVLVLVLVETVLSRWFSHGTMTGRLPVGWFGVRWPQRPKGRVRQPTKP